MTGKILNDTLDTASLNVVNITMRTGAITDSDGYFRIQVRVGDTLNISAIQYESTMVMIDSELFEKGKLRTYLTPKITELEEVFLSDLPLSGNLTADIGRIQVDKVYSPKDFGIPGNTAPERTPEERRLYTAMSSSGGIIPIAALINAITGRTKMLKKHVEVSRLQQRVDRVRALFSPPLFTYNLKIPETLIDDFVFYVLEKHNDGKQLDYNKPLPLFELFEEEATNYLQLRRAMKAEEE